MAIACDLIVIPFSRSSSMLSSTWSFILDLGTVWVRSSSRSASVDFPWSMCAMMQKFRTVSRLVTAESEADMHGDGEARPTLSVEVRRAAGAASGSGDRIEARLFGAEVDVEAGEMGVHERVRHLDQMERD